MENKAVDKALLTNAAVILAKQFPVSLGRGFEGVEQIVGDLNSMHTLVEENRVARLYLYQALDLMEEAAKDGLCYCAERSQLIGFSLGTQVFDKVKLRLNPKELALHLVLSNLLGNVPIRPEPIPDSDTVSKA